LRVLDLRRQQEGDSRQPIVMPGTACSLMIAGLKSRHGEIKPAYLLCAGIDMQTWTLASSL
jgi:hypothetical protein